MTSMERETPNEEEKEANKLAESNISEITQIRQSRTAKNNSKKSTLNSVFALNPHFYRFFMSLCQTIGQRSIGVVDYFM